MESSVEIAKSPLETASSEGKESDPPGIALSEETETGTVFFEEIVAVAVVTSMSLVSAFDLTSKLSKKKVRPCKVPEATVTPRRAISTPPA